MYTSWYDNGQPSSAGKYLIGEVPNGRWQFFHKNGKVSAVELYRLGQLIGKQYFDEQGVPMEDTANHDHPAAFPGGERAWTKFVNKNLYFPSYLDFKNGYTAVVVVTITIGDDGSVENAEILLPLHPAFDKICLDAVKNSPKWVPALSHNRSIRSSFNYVIRFSRNYSDD